MSAHSAENDAPIPPHSDPWPCPDDECPMTAQACTNPTHQPATNDLLARLRDEVIAVIAEALWDGDDADRSQPDYDRVAEWYDDAARNVIPPAKTSEAQR